MIYDTIIIGSGPAGLAAAIYGSRAKLNMLVIEKNYMSGGQINDTYEVDNYPGLPGISGMELGETFRNHAQKLGANFVRAKVLDIQPDGEGAWFVRCKKETYHTKTVILATGASHRKLLVPGEDELVGMGVSYCATCDGAFYKDGVVAVVGGGDVAVEDAIFLARSCKKVYVIHRREELRAAKVLQEKLFSLPNVELLWNTVVERIEGEEQVETLSLYNKKEDQKETLAVDGVFVAVGTVPDTTLVDGIVSVDQGGYVIANEDGITSADGIFAAGDVRTKQLRQIVTAASDGANAITSVERYLIHR